MQSLQGGDMRAEIRQEANGPIVFVERFPLVLGESEFRLRKVFHILPNGELKKVRQVWYDEDGNVIRLFYIGSEGRKFIQVFENGRFSLLDGEKEKIIWVGEYKNNQLSCLKTENKEYFFRYDEQSKTVAVHSKSDLKTKHLTYEEFGQLFGHLVSPLMPRGSLLVNTTKKNTKAQQEIIP